MGSTNPKKSAGSPELHGASAGKIIELLTGAFNVGWLDGLLGVAGMICLIVSQWIIPENSRRLAPVRRNGNFWLFHDR